MNAIMGLADGSSRFIAYYRLPAVQPAPRGLDPEEQRRAVRGYVDEGASFVVAEYWESESRKPAYTLDRRPMLKAALTACRTEAATLLFAHLGRLARNRYFASALVESGIEFEAADRPQARRACLQALSGALRETRVSLPNASATDRGEQDAEVGCFHGNRPPADSRAIVDHYARQIAGVVKALRKQGLSRGHLAAELTLLGVAPPPGTRWNEEVVRCILSGEQRGPPADG